MPSNNVILTDKLAVGPGLESVDRCHEWHRAQDDGQVAERQVQNVQVGRRLDKLLADENDDERHVADDSGDEDEEKHDGHDVGLGPLRVRRVGGRVVRRVALHGQVGVQRGTGGAGRVRARICSGEQIGHHEIFEGLARVARSAARQSAHCH